MRISDWSSDVCSSDLHVMLTLELFERVAEQAEEIVIGLEYGTVESELDHRLHLVDRGKPALVLRQQIRCVHARSGDGLPVDLADCLAHDFGGRFLRARTGGRADRGFRSEEHTSELQSLMRISYAVFCLKKKKRTA